MDLLLEAQKTRRRQEELLVLREVRKTVEALRAEDQAIQQQGRAVHSHNPRKYDLGAVLLISHHVGERPVPLPCILGSCSWTSGKFAVQVEEAINVVASNAEDEFANQAQLKAHEHLETILKAVDVDKFLQGIEQLGATLCMKNLLSEDV